MNEGARTDVLGAGVEVALQGRGLFWEWKPFEDVVGSGAVVVADWRVLRRFM
jgi:hypothetical protein